MKKPRKICTKSALNMWLIGAMGRTATDAPALNPRGLLTNN